MNKFASIYESEDGRSIRIVTFYPNPDVIEDDFDIPYYDPRVKQLNDILSSGGN